MDNIDHLRKLAKVLSKGSITVLDKYHHPTHTFAVPDKERQKLRVLREGLTRR